jgi:hypothetical protein
MTRPDLDEAMTRLTVKWSVKLPRWQFRRYPADGRGGAKLEGVLDGHVDCERPSTRCLVT